MSVTYYPFFLRILHLLLVVTGIIAWLTGDMAEDESSLGYSLHSLVGLSVAAIVGLRVMYGVVAARPNRFWHWWPFSALNLQRCKEDVLGLLRLKVPHRDLHEGIAGLVQLFGILLFLWMGLSGTVMYFSEDHEHGLVHLIHELHEVGESLIPLFLFLHLGGLAAHLITGDLSALQKMFGRRSKDV